MAKRTGNFLNNLGDIEAIFTHTQELWESFRNKRIFITGGTGFFGRWLLESFVWADNKLGLNAEVLVLSRNPQAFLAKAPGLASEKAVSFHKGDITSFVFPKGKFDFMIHAATEASAKMIDEDPVGMVATVVRGTERALEFARSAGVKRFILTSSGAVYGKQPHNLLKVKEDFNGAPDPLDPASAYAEAKLLAELLCATYYKQYNLDCVIARCFAFVGPHLPLNIHYAVGNFIADGLKGGPIRIGGDGTPYRSYMYATDLMIWLWTILVKGQSGKAYNVGSDQAVSIKELAEMVAVCFNSGLEVTIAKTPAVGQKPQRYVPDICRAKEQLGLQLNVNLEDALRKTIDYYRGFYL